MKQIALFTFAAALLTSPVGRAEGVAFQREKLELLVEQAGEMLDEANRKGSATHNATCRYYFGLIYASGTNLLARKDSPVTARLCSQYMGLMEKNYEAYTKVEDAISKAAATGSDRVYVGKHRSIGVGSRHRAKRIANAEKLGDKELANAIRLWERFAADLKKNH